MLEVGPLFVDCRCGPAAIVTVSPHGQSSLYSRSPTALQFCFGCITVTGVWKAKKDAVTWHYNCIQSAPSPSPCRSHVSVENLRWVNALRHFLYVGGRRSPAPYCTSTTATHTFVRTSKFSFVDIFGTVYLTTWTCWAYILCHARYTWFNRHQQLTEILIIY